MSLQTLKQSTCLKYFKLVHCSRVPNKKVIFASCSMIFSNCFQWLHTKHWSIIKEFGTGGNSNKSQIYSVLNCFIIIPWCYNMFFQIIIKHKIILTNIFTFELSLIFTKENLTVIRWHTQHLIWSLKIVEPLCQKNKCGKWWFHS